MLSLGDQTLITARKALDDWDFNLARSFWVIILKVDSELVLDCLGRKAPRNTFTKQE